MPREQFQSLTEPMYYILLCLLEECCGVDIMEKVSQISGGRVSMGPGTLYTLLGKFENEAMIEETASMGRKRWYLITAKGKNALIEERERLRRQLEDGNILEGL